MTTDVVLLGFGAIGRELTRQLAANARPSGAPIRICGVIDRSGYVFDAAGLGWRRLMSLRARKSGGSPLASTEGGVASDSEASIDAIANSLGQAVLVDLTASETSVLLERVVARGWDVVLANKVPLTGREADVDRLLEAIAASGGRLRHEATVGAGLPVIDTLHKLVDSGDRVISIEGCPSGTLGFVFGELSRGCSFSTALAAAVAAGYTEPDPRDDLCGLDVARKALILGRLLGFRGELDDVAVESLVPPALAEVPRADFLARVEEVDAHWAQRVARAAEQGKVLRYRVRVTRKSITVGLVEVGTHEPLGALDGTDNQFAFWTMRYRERPLVITGPGAGPAVTAAGVYNDLIGITTSNRERTIDADLWRSPRALDSLHA